jgi:hypothetical protein
MRAFVRLLPRLLFLAVAAAALLVLAERARSAHADALPPITAPAPPEAPSLSPTPLPSLPAPPPVTPPSLSAPSPLPALPSPPVLTAPTLPGVIVPALPGVPTPPDLTGAPAAPEVPGAPAVDPESVTGILGPLPGVPEVAPPEPLLPDLPAVPEVPDVPVPLDRVLELGATPAPDAPAPANAPDRAPAQLLADPSASRADARDVFPVVFGGEVGIAPARGPPVGAPGSPHPCPGGGSSHPNRTDPAAFLDPAADEASRRAGSLAEARAYASTLLRDPLLRPD